MPTAFGVLTDYGIRPAAYFHSIRAIKPNAKTFCETKAGSPVDASPLARLSAGSPLTIVTEDTKDTKVTFVTEGTKDTKVTNEEKQL